MSFGLRVKSFADGRQARSVRTLDMFLTTLIEAAGGLPEGFVVTFPKVNTAEHVAIFAEVLERLELGLGLPDGTLRFEVQVETPRSVIALDGAVAAPRILDAAGGRLTAMHVGVFDYTASLGLMPWEQRLDHPANDLARQLLQVALAGTGVAISDGSSNVVPASDRTEDVHAAWRVHAGHVRHSLSAGFYQGWDLHPAHLVSRYAAVYGWLLPHLDDATVARRRLARGRRLGRRARRAGDDHEPAPVPAVRGVVRSGRRGPRSWSGQASPRTSCAGAGRARAVTHPDGVEILGSAEAGFDEILTDEALAFVAGLQREFGARRVELLEARAERQIAARRGRASGLPRGDPARCGTRTGGSRQRRPTCATAGSRSPAPPTARW